MGNLYSALGPFVAYAIYVLLFILTLIFIRKLKETKKQVIKAILICLPFVIILMIFTYFQINLLVNGFRQFCNSPGAQCFLGGMNSINSPLNIIYNFISTFIWVFFVYYLIKRIYIGVKK